MMYQYFDAQDRKIQAEIDFYENKISGNLSYDDLHRLEYLRIQRETYNKIFRDLCSFLVDFPSDLIL